MGTDAPQDQDKLTGDALDARAAELEIEGRSDMSADEKREAIAAREEADGDGAPAQPAQGDPSPVNPGSTNVRSDADVPVHSFARVTAGEHKGRYGVVDGVSSYGGDGFPETVVFRTRDSDDLRLEVPYKDLEPAEPGAR